MFKRKQKKREKELLQQWETGKYFQMGMFKRKQKKREKELLQQWEAGKYLRVDEDIDNRELFLGKVVPPIKPKDETIEEKNDEVIIIEDDRFRY